MIEKIKGAWRSWVIWTNGIAGTLVVLLPVAQDSFPQLQQYIPANVYQWGMAIVIAANIILRFKTTMDLSEKVK